MSAMPLPTDGVPEQNSHQPEAGRLRQRMSTRQRFLFFLTAWLIVLMPFLFWWNTWFGRALSDQQMTEYLNDERHPRHIQHALIQIAERMARGDSTVNHWYPDLIRLASNPVEEVRKTDAWVMGQDNSLPAFHQKLTSMLNDPSLMVRGNAALSLVRFGDASGRAELVNLLQPARITSPIAGQLTDSGKIGAAVHQNGLVAKVKSGEQTTEIRSPIGGRIRSIAVSAGRNISVGVEIATIDPDTEQVWEALRALFLVGQPEDLPAIVPYERNLPDVPDRVRQQAVLTDKAIRSRPGKSP